MGKLRGMTRLYIKDNVQRFSAFFQAFFLGGGGWGKKNKIIIIFCERIWLNKQIVHIWSDDGWAASFLVKLLLIQEVGQESVCRTLVFI